MSESLKEKLEKIPTAPGVYLFKDKHGVTVYIGKAKNLRARLRNYATGTDTRTFALMIDTWFFDVEIIITGNEKEALILENELVKRHRPRFNVRLTDDKQFLSLRISTTHPYPRIEVVRQRRQDEATYFGPYHSAAAIRQSLRIINRHFQLRTCTDQVLANRDRPCMQYQIKRCPAPCVFEVPKESYAASVRDVAHFLLGQGDILLKDLKKRMIAASEEQNYEHAAILRDQISAIQHSLEHQQIVARDFSDRDIIGMHRHGTMVTMHMLRVIGGRLQDAHRFMLKGQHACDSDIMADFIAQYYGRFQDGPHEIITSVPFEFSEEIAQHLSGRWHHTVKIVVPQRGHRMRLLKLANQNAEQMFSEAGPLISTHADAIHNLQNIFYLKHLPRIIECFDISHTQGKNIVASQVCLKDGKPYKARYRRYKIKSLITQDDCKSIYETISRRARRGLENGDLPQLMLIDGGKGQLNAAQQALRDFGIDTVDVLALAKARTDGHKTPNSTEADVQERVFAPDTEDAIVLEPHNEALLLLQRARDEAHRFAIAYHRRLQKRDAAHSQLDKLIGIGPKRRHLLLKSLGSYDAICAASEKDLQEILGPKIGTQIYRAIKQPIASASVASFD